MNQKHQPNIDAMFEPESPETSAKLDAFEQRLKATRPQSPELDLAGLQRVAKAEATVELPAKRNSRSVVMLAGSWICGVVVGAMVMFLLMSNLAPDNTSNNKDQSVSNKDDSPTLTAEHSPSEFSLDEESELPAESAIATTSESRQASKATLAMVNDPLERVDSAFFLEGPTLHASVHRRQASSTTSWPFGVIAEPQETKETDIELRPSESRAKNMRTQEPGSPTSRRELMKEFLGERADAVL